MDPARRARVADDVPRAAAATRLLARRLGTIYLAAAAVGSLALLFPPAPYAVDSVAYATAAGAALVGVALLLGVADRAPRGALHGVVALGTLLAALAAYGAGSPEGGGELFFLWTAPFAFAFFSGRGAAGQVALVGAAYATVLATQHHAHPAAEHGGVLVGAWLLVTGSVAVVGLLVRHLARSVRDAERRFRRGFEDSPVAAAFLGLDLRFLEVNAALCRLLGRAAHELVGTSVLEVVAAEDAAEARWLRVEPGGPTLECESRFVRPDGRVVWASVAGSLVSPELGPAYRFCQFRDVTDHRRDREALAHQAIHDPLTGLYNRTQLVVRTNVALARQGRDGLLVGIVLLDLDQFKIVNDSLGHAAGDAVLVALAPRLAEAVAPGDTIARLGGDEFVVLLERLATAEEALDRAERLAAALAVPLLLETGPYVATASIGVAVATGSECTATSLLRDADAAMYRAKASGRNTVRVFDQSMRFEALRRLQLEHDLRDAVEGAGGLLLEYQPVVDVATGRPVFLEALVRWEHPTRGRIGPEEFIPVAEQSGLVVPLGEWVLTEAIAQLAAWQLVYLSDPPLKISVNVSGYQLATPGFAERVAALLAASPIAPRSLAVEITESVILDVHAANDALEALRALGVSVLLDDFGTGYSSLAYLEQFPIDALKIDRSFVARLDEGSERAVVLEAIVSMARALRLAVIAEGVEHRAQVDKLRRLGCTSVQGYAVAPPLPGDRVVEFLLEQQTVARALAKRWRA